MHPSRTRRPIGRCSVTSTLSHNRVVTTYNTSNVGASHATVVQPAPRVQANATGTKHAQANRSAHGIIEPNGCTVLHVRNGIACELKSVSPLAMCLIIPDKHDERGDCLCEYVLQTKHVVAKPHHDSIQKQPHRDYHNE